LSKKEKEILEEELEKDTEVAQEEAEATTDTPDSEEQTEENKTEADAEDKEESGKKGLFGKKDKKDPLKAKVEELQDKYMRQVAEFDNFRKRTDKEKAQMFSQGEASVLEKMLPILDNFERGLATTPEDESSKAFVDGMNMIYKQFVKQLEDLGVTPIEAVGKEFDPNLHNAVMQVESEEVEEGFVAQELQKGYMHHDTVLRHSMVAVAK